MSILKHGECGAAEVRDDVVLVIEDGSVESDLVDLFTHYEHAAVVFFRLGGRLHRGQIAGLLS
jgi:hypothetical protein